MLEIQDNQIVTSVPFADLTPGDIFRLKEGEDFKLFLKISVIPNKRYAAEFNAVSLDDFQVSVIDRYTKVLPVHKAILILE